GALISGDVVRLEAKVSLGDVHIGGNAKRIVADYDGVTKGPEFSFRGLHMADLAFDGIVGMIYVAGQIDYLNVGDGLYGGTSPAAGNWAIGGVPVGGVFTPGEILRIVASSASIEGPIFATNGIGVLSGSGGTAIRNTAIGAGAAFADWALWSQMTAPTERIRLQNITLKGLGAGITGSRIQTGVLGKLYVKGGGIIGSEIWVSGDPDTGEGINRIVVSGGVLDSTSAPPYVASSLGIFCGQRIGVIILTNGVDLINTDITSFKSLGVLKVGGDIIFDGDMSIAAPHGMSSFYADRVVATGGGTLHIGAGLVRYMRFYGDCGANIQVDGTVGKAIIDGQLLQAFSVVGPHGSVGRLLIRGGIAPGATVTASNYIGDMDVYGDVAANIIARGSNGANLAIGSLHIWGGSLLANVLTEVDPVPGHALPVRPGGGIGVLYVRNGSVVGDVTTTSYFDPGNAIAVTGDIHVFKIVNGDLAGNVTTLRHDGAAPESDVRKLIVLNGQFVAGRTVRVTGNLGYTKIWNKGGVAVAGAVIVQGAIGRFYTRGDIITDLFAGLGIEVLTLRSTLAADVYSGGRVGTVTLYGDMIGNFVVANGGMYAFYCIGGQIQAANPAKPVIEVAEHLSYLKVYGGDPLTPAIDGDVQVGKRVRTFVVKQGSFAGRLDAENIDRAIYATPDGITQPLTVTGYLDYLRVVHGPIAAPVTAGAHMGNVYAYHGSTAAGTITAGAGLDYLYARDTVRGAVTVLTGHLKNVNIYNAGGVALETVIDVQNGDFRKLTARGAVLNSMLLAANGFFGPVLVIGDFTDSALLCQPLAYV
ncbi:hypothetical protein HQ560_19620, partial [bacterium]|nr:hypothetical protein [bacterium]